MRKHTARRALTATTAAALLTLTACGFEEGPPGTITGKPKNLDCDWIGTGQHRHQSCAWEYSLTTRGQDGAEHTFRVDRDDYNACYHGSAYPGCTEAR